MAVFGAKAVQNNVALVGNAVAVGIAGENNVGLLSNVRAAIANGKARNKKNNFTLNFIIKNLFDY